MDVERLPGPESYPPASPAIPESPRHWGYWDLLWLVGFAVASLLFAMAAAFIAIEGIRLTTGTEVSTEGGPYRVMALLCVQLVWWLFIVAFLYYIVEVKYSLPFWRSIGWRSYRLPSMNFVSLGFLMALGVSLGASLIPMPEESLPIEELLGDPLSIALMAAFGILIAPPIEEMVFRGFLFPVIERSGGGPLAILVTSTVFSVLHAQQYGGHWQILLVLFIVGAALGYVRYRTDSVAPPTLMHMAYNATLFTAFLFANHAGAETS